MKKFSAASVVLFLISPLGAQTPPPTTTHSVKLTWVAPVSTTTPPPPTSPSPYTYNVYKYGGMPGNVDPPICANTAVSSFAKIASNLTVLSYTDGPGIPNGVTRCYFVTTVDATGNESDPSIILSVLVALPLPTKPPVPTGVTFTVI